MIGAPEFSAYNDSNFTNLINTQLENVAPTEDFYTKLLTLKNEQKKTLMVMEELYNQKQVLRDEVQKSEATLNNLRHSDLTSNQDKDYKYRLNTVSAYEDMVKYPLNTVMLGASDGPKPNSKPPMCPTRNSVSFQKSVQIVDPQPTETKSDLTETKSQKMLDSLSEGIKKIETMWDNFSVNDMNNTTMRSLDFNERFEKKIKKSQVPMKKKQQIQVEWVPRVTIPQPFSMSIREQLRNDKKKENMINEMRDEREKRIEAEIRECKKKFKAKPVPAHVKEPLYENQRAADNFRKQKLREMQQEYTYKVTELENEQEAKLNQLTSKDYKSTGPKKQTNATTETFNAQPLPDFYFNEFANEEIKEQEMYKQIQRQMRALEMLKESKLPNNMGLMEEKKLLEMERNQLFMTEMNRMHKELNDKELQQANLRKNHDVPDYDEQYKNFTIQLEKRKAFNRKNTKAAPFQLRSASRTSCRKACATVEAKPRREAAMNRSNSSMSRLNRSVSQSMDSLPIKYTESQRLRESTNKNKLNEVVRKEMQQEHIEKMKSIRMKKLHDQIKEKSNYVPNEVEKNIERQTRKLKLDQRRQEEEYEQHLAEMGEKVNSRKLQIEKIEEDNKRKALEKKCNEALRKLEELEDGVQMAKPLGSSTANVDDWINED